MPASYDQFHETFENVVGTDESFEYTDGHSASGFDQWLEIFESTGIAYPESADLEMQAFEGFLSAFYPDPESGADWQQLRDNYYDEWGITAEDIDWEAYREAIGY